MKKSIQAAQHFCDGCSCAQAVLTTYSDKYGLDVEQSMKMTAGLAGGIGKMGQTCGTITGSVLVIGLEKNSGKPHDHESKEKTMQAIHQFTEQFEKKHGSLVCKELLGSDLSQPDGYRQARDSGAFKERCPNFVATSVELLEELLNAEKHRE